MGDEYEELRKAWLDGMLVEAGEEIKYAGDPLRLARARELWKRATWYAERRDRKRYGDDARLQVSVSLDLDISGAMRRAEERLAGRVIDAEPLDVVAEPPKELSASE